MYSGEINSTGARYCPSIEDKINKFSSKNSHQIFLEPEGLIMMLFIQMVFQHLCQKLCQKEFIHTIKGT